MANPNHPCNGVLGTDFQLPAGHLIWMATQYHEHIPLLSTNLLLLSPLPIPCNSPTILPTTQKQNPETIFNSSFSFTNDIQSASPVGSISGMSAPTLPVPWFRPLPLPLDYCKSHLTCVHALGTGFVKHRLTHVISPEKNVMASLCPQKEHRTPWRGIQGPP